jgi:predicted transcriptional regulator
MNQNDSNSETQELNQNDSKRITLSIRVTEEEYIKILAIAKATESSISRILRLAVKQFLKGWEDAEDIK